MLNNNSRPLKILMATNTYQGIVGGLEKSVQSFSRQFREWGHEVLIAGPDFVGEELQNQDTQTPLGMPFAHRLIKVIDRFNPDIIHAHHPFLMGEMALRFAARYDRPLIFTYHILFSGYAHYLGGGSPVSNRFLVELAAGYANNVTRMIAPSESVREILRQEGVHKEIDVVPTGVAIKEFSKGDRETVRRKLGLQKKNILLGHIGRISVEKNIQYLAENVKNILRNNKEVHFLLAGKGPLLEDMKSFFSGTEISARVHLPGALQGQDLVDHYHALDLFVFTSQSETQGMVLTEAMAAGVPVIGLDAPGVREIVRDGENGRLVTEDYFFEALKWCVGEAATEKWEAMRRNARETADLFSVERCAQRALDTYYAALEEYPETRIKNRPFHRVKVEIDILYNFFRACFLALVSPRPNSQ